MVGNLSPFGTPTMSIRPALVFAFAALTLPLSLGACASAPRSVALVEPAPMYAPLPPPPPQEQPVEILAELPANAPPGECYAKVVVPGQREVGLPQAQGARWVQSAGPPGSPGPIWCLVPAGPEPVAFAPERYGFIRVLCDTDITRDRVVGIQRHLHEGGYYAGAYTGQYDASTAQAVTRFQSAQHIAHGGYLSVETVRAIEAPPVQVQQQVFQQQYVQPQVIQGPPVYAPPIYQQPVYQQPVYQQPAPVYAGYQGGYASATASASASASAGGYGYGIQASYPGPGPGYPPQAQGPGYNANYYGTSGNAGYGQGFWSGPGQPGGVGSTPQLPYPLPYDNYGPGPAAWPAPGFGPQGYPRPAYAAPNSAVQSGWLNWSGKSYF